MRATRKYSKRPGVSIGDVYAGWTVRDIRKPDVLARCQCGAERWMRADVLRHHNAQCRPCAAKARKVNPKLANGRPAHVWQAIQALSELQKQYAAALIRSRQKIEEDSHLRITRVDVTDAIEMARSLTSAQLEQELRDLRPRYHAETRQSYNLYHSPKGAQL